MEPTHMALLAEIRRRLSETRDDPRITNTDGSNYWGPYVTRAINDRENDGSALVAYIKDVIRNPGESEGWNALLEAERLDLSFEDMVLTAEEPIRTLFTDEDRSIAARLLQGQSAEIEQRRARAEAEAVERDHRILQEMAHRRLMDGKPELTDAQRAAVLADRASRRESARASG